MDADEIPPLPPQCTHVYGTGHPCRNPARAGQTTCESHSPDLWTTETRRAELARHAAGDPELWPESRTDTAAPSPHDHERTDGR